jgi:starch-binding outer membrane protein, SusD/RagB family
MEYKNKNSMWMRYLLLIPAFMLIISSCADFLDEVPTGSLTDLATYNTPDDVVTLSNGPYRRLANWVSGADDWGNNLPGTMEYQTGKATAETPHVQLWRYQTNAINGNLLGNFNNQWGYWFSGVQDANFTIQMLNRVDGVSQAVVSAALGEAHTLRAFYYFCLVRYWGDVPMITEPLANVSEAEQARVSLKTIYDEVIVPDLLFAINESTLPSGRSSGRVTKDVARALLADVYITMAGYPYQEVATNPTKMWSQEGGWSMSQYPVNNASAIEFLQGAKTQLDALYNSGTYSLGTYDDLRNPARNNQGEAIFQVQYMAGVSHNNVVNFALPLMSHIRIGGDENGTFVPALSYINSYNPNDKRRQERQMFFTTDTYARDFDPNESPVTFSRPYLFKYYDQAAIKQTAQPSLNWTHYRYADILLLLTEVNWALRQLGVAVSDTDITKGINAVRARAELPLYSAAEVGLFEIMAERAYELIFENKMMWDQRRTRHCLVDGEGQFTRIESFFGHQPVDFSFQFSEMNLLSPIGGNEMRANGNMQQNFGHLPQQDR